MENLTTVSDRSIGEGANVESAADACTLTKNENLVYEVLKDADRPMKAYEMLALLHDKGMKAPMTVYRALEGLQAKALAQKVFSQNTYVGVNREAQGGSRAVVTCRQCGDARLVPFAKNEVAADLGSAEMSLTDIVVEVVGACDGKACLPR